MNHDTFLHQLRENPADTAAWLVYADWLEDQGDPTATFVRRSLEVTAGVGPADVAEVERLHDSAHPDARELLAAYRASLPARFRVLDRFLIGEDPPREMFGYARTVVTGYLEAGRLRPGAKLGVGRDSAGRPR